MQRRVDSAVGRGEVGLVAFLLVVWLLTWAPRLRGPIDLRWDAAVYYTLGTSLATGNGYRLLNEPGEILAIQYPPGLPLIVALHQRMLGTADPVLVGIALRWFYFAVSGLSVGAVFWYLRGMFGVPAGVAGALICALGMNFVWLSDRCYSDVPFLLATTAFMLCARRQTRWGNLAAAAAASAAFLLRTLGAALLVAWVAEAAVAREWRRCSARLLLALVLIAGWQAYVWSVERSPSYRTPVYPYQRAPYLLHNVSYTTNASLLVPFSPELGRISSMDRFKRFAGNAAAVPSTLGEVLSTTSMNWSDALAPLRSIPVLGLLARWRLILAGLMLLGLLTLAGLWLQLRSGQIREAVFVVTYVLAVCVMNFTDELGRYLTGIQPILIGSLFALVFGIRAPRLTSRVRAAGMALLVTVVLTGAAATLVRAYATGFPQVSHRQWHGHDVSYRLFTYSEASSSFDRGIEWLAVHSAAGDVIASSQPHWVYIRTGRRAVMPPFERDAGRHQALLDSVPVTYVIVDAVGFSATREYSLPVLRSGRAWNLVYETGDGHLQVYRRRQDESRE